MVYVPLQQPPQQIPHLLALMFMSTVTSCYGTANQIGLKGYARNLAIIVMCAMTFTLILVLIMQKMVNVKKTLGEIIW